VRRPVRRRFPTKPTFAFALLALLLLLRLFGPQEPRRQGLPEAERLHVVQRVVDGDTLLLSGGERVRLIGVDTPETKLPNTPPEPFGPEASRFTQRFVERQEVRLEYDLERRDQYERVLAYVYRDGELLNEELIRAGLSPAVTSFPYRSDMKRRFEAAEAEARAARRGLWSQRRNDSER
jgi:micrococcal nuclease